MKDHRVHSAHGVVRQTANNDSVAEDLAVLPSLMFVHVRYSYNYAIVL